MWPSAESIAERVDGYARVSQVNGRFGERFISPKMQREQIKRWASKRGVRVLTIFEDYDVSGARADRPSLELVIERVESGVSRGVVVASIDRFWRSTTDGLLAIKRITDAGGGFYSVQEGLDFTTDAGRWFLREALSKAEWDLDRIRTIWDQARARAIARGVSIAPNPPMGYRRTRAGRLRRDPRTADFVRELFERRAAGESIPELCRLAEAREIRTRAGNVGWNRSTMVGVIRNRAYLGEVRSHPYVREHAHEPLVDLATWHAAQHPRPPSHPRHWQRALLGGLVRCMACGKVLANLRTFKGDLLSDHWACRCRSAAGHCPAPASISAGLLQPSVEEVVFDLLRRRRRPATARVAQAEELLTRAQESLARYRDSDRVLATLGPDSYAEGLRIRSRRVERASLRIAELRHQHTFHALPATAEIEDRWPNMDMAARRAIVAVVIDCVFVARGHGDGPSRIFVCPAGTAPADLSRSGRRHSVIRSYAPRREWIDAAVRRDEISAWPPARLEQELRDFAREYGVLPDRNIFSRTGHGRLYLQMLRQGGPQHWARRLGLRSAHRSHIAWNDDRIRATLEFYLADKPTWPSRRQFRADGMTTLHGAVGRRGGVGRWARELRIPRPERTKRNHGQRPYWTDDLLRVELTAFCAGRQRFPSSSEFRAAGRGYLAAALYERGGSTRWAAELGLPLHPQSRSTGRPARQRRPRRSLPKPPQSGFTGGAGC